VPHARVEGIRLYYEETGEGQPLVFVHEWGGEVASWKPQVRYFARRYRTIAFNARGYPPSDAPEDPAAYSQPQAVADIRGLLDALGIDRAHVCGLSMGGYATLLFGDTLQGDMDLLGSPEAVFARMVDGAIAHAQFGNKENLAMVPVALIDRTVGQVKKKLTLKQVAIELTKPCVCGVFNPTRAEELLQRFL
jgi:pimeloyl-ACP methyl ester carboxylesterase